MAYTITVYTQKEEMMPQWPLLRQLNPDVTEAWLDEVLDDMLAHGYRMVAVLDGTTVVGVSGIWTSTKIYSGKYLEMDNVVVAASHRSKGIGSLMTEYIIALALREGCRTMMLDAYMSNHKAHLFYERVGFERKGYHFVKDLLGNT